jgi:Tfp pilus assembly PilM family ATPase
LYDAIHPCLMYYQDKYADAVIEKIALAAPHPLGGKMLAALSEQTGIPVMQLDPMPFFQSCDGHAIETAKQALIPSLGLALGKY